MRQALHIFKKDIRHLWLEISIALATAAAFTFTVARGAEYLNNPETTQGLASTLLTYLLPVAWWALIARLVHAEPLPGVRQFWVTRPYAWKSLLAAKALFAIVFVNLPMLIGHAVILHAYGFQIQSQLGGLLWIQVLLTAAFVLPIVALSALTTGFVQLIAVSGLLVLAVIGWATAMPEFGAGAPWLALEWTRSYFIGLVLAIAALTIILRQYGRRDTTTSRFLAGGATLMAFVALAWLPWPAAFAIQTHLSAQEIDASAVRVGFHPDMKWAARAIVNKDDSVDVDIPLRVAGIPVALRTRVDGIIARIEGAAGVVRLADHQPWTNPIGTGTSFHASVDSSFYRKIKDKPVRIRGSVYLTLYGNPRHVFLPAQDQTVFLPTPGVGLCAAVRNGRGIVLNCRSAFKSRPDLVTFDLLQPSHGGLPPFLLTMSYSRPISYSPFPADANLIPVTQSMQIAEISGPVLGVSAVAIEPVAHIRREFVITGLRLAEYEVRP